MSFAKLGLSEPLHRAIKEMGFENPTDIQEKALPILLESETDFIGLAQTGTGKTASFGLPLLQNLNPKDSFIQGLILAPTRELCRQITDQLYSYSKYLKKVKILPVYGGASIGVQLKELKKGQHVIVATPGRLIDLINRKAIKLDRISHLILDEADEMLNMGFKEDIDQILEYTPEEKLTWLFSATMPPAIKTIVKKYMTEPQEVVINPKEEVNANISHYFAVVKSSNKADALRRFLDVIEDLRCVIFCRTKIATQQLAEYLMKHGHLADSLHGDLSQAQRDRVMARFRQKNIEILVATDVAARGIDVNDISHVFHYSLPDDLSYYTHRSGRTARAGKSGASIAFISGKELYRISKLERALKIKINKVLVPKARDIIKTKLESWLDKIKSTPPIHYIEPELMTHVQMSLADVSKEELIEKILSIQLNKLQFENNKDLNDKEGPGGRERGRSGRDRGGSRRKRGGGKHRSKRRDRNSKRSGNKKKFYGNSGSRKKKK